MKKVIKLYLVIVFFFLFSISIKAKTANVYLFYGKECPHCHDAITYLDSIKDKYDFKLIKYEVWHNPDNQKLMKKVGDKLDVNTKGVPFVVIDNTPIVGFASGNTDNTYIYHIKKANDDSFNDEIAPLLGLKDKKKTNSKAIKKVGVIDLKATINLSFIISTVLVTFILLNVLDKKKIIIVSTSLITIINLMYVVLLLNNVSFDNLINNINFARVFLSVILMIIGMIGLINIIRLLDNKNMIKLPIKLGIVLSIVLSLISMVSILFISIFQMGGISSNFINFLNNYSTIKKVLIVLLYFVIITAIDVIYILCITKVLDLFKLYNKDNKVSLILKAMVILLLGIILGANIHIFQII